MQKQSSGNIQSIFGPPRNRWTVTSKVVGISFNTSAINEVFISKGAFKGMPNLRFLNKYDGCDRMDISEEIELPQRLRFLHWKAYPSKCLPATFNSECLVELDLRESQLEKLWEGIQWIGLNPLYSSRLIFIFPMWDVSHQYPPSRSDI
ncbi:hypothetical protein YC2023_114790 [Brassica napus]